MIVNKPRKYPIFVVHKHFASHLHYDFRLEIDGVLKSWVLPKIPSTVSNIKRLAIPVEDHPLSYATFQGTIPKGNYGAGEVIIWDEGDYENLSNKSLTETYQEGELKIKLNGNKLHGSYVLIKTNLEPLGKQKEKWLFIKLNN